MGSPLGPIGFLAQYFLARFCRHGIRFASNQKVVGYSHDIHAAIAPMGSSVQVHAFCDSQDS